MNGTSHTFRRALQALVLTASVAAVAVPTATAGSGGPGLVPSKLGTPDTRQENRSVSSAGLIPSTLGSQDPRDTASESVSGASVVARQLGSQDPRDTAFASVSESESSVVARQLGSQDPRDTASAVIAESSIVARQLGTPDTRDAAQPAWLRALEIRGEGMNELYADGNQGSVGTVEGASSNGGFDFGNLEIGIVVAVCGLLLLTALGIGARQARHTRHRLGSV